MGRAAQLPLRSNGQNRRMWSLVGDLRSRSGLSEEDAKEVLRRFCRECSGQDHSSQLSGDQADRVIRKLSAEIAGYTPSKPAARKPWGERGPGPRPNQRVTPCQQQVLQALFEQAGMDTPERRMGFCKRQFGLPWAQTQAHADALYEPLKAIILRSVTAADLQARVQALVGRTDLDAWKTDFVADLDRQFTEAARTGRVKSVVTTHKLLKLIECELAASEEEGT